MIRTSVLLLCILGLIYAKKNIVNKEGESVPQTVFKTRVKEGGSFIWKDLSTDDVFKGKNVVLFSLPGAFTPTCSSKHLPTYDSKVSEFKKQGIDTVACMSVNDAFVMNAWGKELGVKDVLLLPDGSAHFTHAMGMLVEKQNLGFGSRSWRYSMLVKDGKIVKQFVEPGFSDNCADDPYEVSDPDTMLNYLKENKDEL
ncbi:peroxiredoxin [Acrasis kona]|uniref:Peroxiredoxin n=1 Tax=Acrasis kona TaxID=1008807 RepID=A0AAW2YSP8_9EUKA